MALVLPATGFVAELADTQVDALMCCPQAWMTPLWPSEIDRKWQDEAPQQVEPPAEADRRYFDRAYWRIRRYMLQGKDPVALSLAAARHSSICLRFTSCVVIAFSSSSFG